jgi:class 3 adenylate cyclase
VTARFADIVGSTSLSERMDPEDFDAVIRETIARMTTVAKNYGGEVHELNGDGLLALFGAAITRSPGPALMSRRAYRRRGRRFPFARRPGRG